MSEDMLLVEKKDYVGTLAFNRPERKNALSPELLVKMHLQLEEWARGDEVRCLIITGGGDRSFSSGFDIGSIPTDVDPEMEKILREHNPLELALNGVRNFPYPTIAMLNGYAFGAGLNMCVCCDMRIAADDVKIGMPPAKLGLIYHPEGLRQFVEALGFAKTRELFFTARTFVPGEVRELGVMDHIVPRDNLREYTYDLAATIAKNAPLSLKGMKRILNMMGNTAALEGDDLLEAEQLIRDSFNSEDLKEGQMAFLEKRTPNFTGK
ncbi:MAG: enoyl-CoA hydratase/isomerase family protein [Desulfatibacillaceae bacterium]